MGVRECEREQAAGSFPSSPGSCQLAVSVQYLTPCSQHLWLKSCKQLSQHLGRPANRTNTLAVCIDEPRQWLSNDLLIQVKQILSLDLLKHLIKKELTQILSKTLELYSLESSFPYMPGLESVFLGRQTHSTCLLRCYHPHLIRAYNFMPCSVPPSLYHLLCELLRC